MVPATKNIMTGLFYGNSAALPDCAEGQDSGMLSLTKGTRAKLFFGAGAGNRPLFSVFFSEII